MRTVLQSPSALLLIVGALLGVNFPLAKMAREAGVPSLVWAALISGGAAVLLGLIHLARQAPTPVDPRHLRYFCVTALVSYALPNALVLNVVPSLGAGMTAMLFALSPLITTLFALLARLRTPGPLEFAGIAAGILGSIVVVAGRGDATAQVGGWAPIALGLCIPISLAFGNIYRTIDWPKNADPIWLAFGSNAAAGLLLIALASILGEAGGASTLSRIPLAVAAQLVASTLMFLLFFRLQLVGGPVTLSQIGVVGAGVGVLLSGALLGERYPPLVWAGAVLIGAGLALAIIGRRDRREAARAVQAGGR